MLPSLLCQGVAGGQVTQRPENGLTIMSSLGSPLGPLHSRAVDLHETIARRCRGVSLSVTEQRTQGETVGSRDPAQVEAAEPSNVV